MIEIIPFQENHQDQLVNLILSIQQIEFNVPISSKQQPDLFIINEFYRKNGGEFWVALSGDQVVGSIALIRLEHQKGAIRKMFVHKHFRGKEFRTAQRLFDTLVDYCKATAIRDVYLGTIDRLVAALRFYEKNGFSLVDQETLPADFPFMEVDNVFCKLNLKIDWPEQKIISDLT